MVEKLSGSDSGSSYTYTVEAGTIKKGGYAMLRGHPCKVVETTLSQQGRGDGPLISLIGIDIFSYKKYEELFTPSQKLEVPHVTRKKEEVKEGASHGLPAVLLKPPLDLEEQQLIAQLSEGVLAGQAFSVVVLCATGQEKIVESTELS